MQKAETKPQVSLTIVLCLLPDGKNRKTRKHLNPASPVVLQILMRDLTCFFFLLFDKNAFAHTLLDGLWRFAVNAS